MKVGSLFSGIGGFDLGLVRAGMEIVFQVEIDDFCRKVLAKHAPEYWHNAERFNDVKEVGKHNLKPVDLICGGFPCQPFSQAGKQRGKADDRYLWPEMLRVIRELKPRWIIGENVAGFINMELENTLIDLEAEGYKVEVFVLPAYGVGLPHERNRVWIVAYSNKIYGGSWMELHTKYPKTILENNNRYCLESQQAAISTITRKVDGLSSKLDKDRLGALGNAVVPQIVEILGRCIMEIENDT